MAAALARRRALLDSMLGRIGGSSRRAPAVGTAYAFDESSSDNDDAEEEAKSSDGDGGYYSDL